MDPTTTVLMLMLAVTVLALFASKLGVPYPTMMVVGGLLICFLPGVGEVQIPPKLIFVLFLPPLLYGAAWQISWKEFWSNRRQIFLLAVGLVLFTTAGVAGMAMQFMTGFTWASAFALGAIVSPPDAIAVTAVASKVRLPRRVVFLLEGESMVNDAAALVALKFAVAAGMTGVFYPALAAGQFVVISVGGVALGMVMGWFVAELHRRLRDPLIETTITFLTPYATYLLAEQVHVSGVLATVTAGLYLSWRSPVVMKPQVRLEAYAVWDFVLFMLNGLVFVMVGLGLKSVMRELQTLADFTTEGLLGEGLLLVMWMIFLRMAWVIAGAYLPWILSAKVRRTERRPPIRHVILLGWTGMRGVVSLAGALALEMNFANRARIIFLTFFTILMTLVLQSLTLPLVVRLLGVVGEGDEVAEEREARLYAARAALQFIKDLTESTDAFGAEGDTMRTHYERRVARLESGPLPLPVEAVGLETSVMDLRREVLSAERQAIVEMRSNQKITPEVFRRLMIDVDAEEMRMLG